MSDAFIQTSLPPFILPSQARVAPNSSLQFTAGGGTGTGYVFTLSQNNTGGTISTDGLWQAGPLVGTDQIKVTDSAGNTAVVNAQALNGPTFADIRDQARQRADMVNDGNIDEDELKSYVNASYAELWDLLANSFADTYYMAVPYFVTTDGTNDQYPYPPDFFKLRGIDLQLANTPNAYITLRRSTFKERNVYAIPIYRAAFGAISFRYMDMGSHFRLTPQPTSGRVLRLWYVPRVTKLVNDGDVVDGINGWEDYIVVDAAIKMLMKQESDASGFKVLKDDLKKRIMDSASHRDVGTPPVAGDTCYDDYYDPWGNGRLGGGWNW